MEGWFPELTLKYQFSLWFVPFFSRSWSFGGSTERICKGFLQSLFNDWDPYKSKQGCAQYDVAQIQEES